MLENAQIIKEHGQAKFAVIEFEEFQMIKELLSNPEKLEDYLDYLHVQEVKQKESGKVRTDLEDAKRQLGLE